MAARRPSTTLKPRGDLRTAAIAVLGLTIVLGVAYPLAMTGVSQLGFGDRADGRPQLIARAFTLGSGRPDPRYFQPRPSQSDYSAGATFFSNRGPGSPLARAFYRKQLAAYLALNGPYDPGLTRARVPVDAVTTSGSGVDPTSCRQTRGSRRSGSRR